MPDIRMTPAQRDARFAEIMAEMDRLQKFDDWTANQRAKYYELDDEAEQIVRAGQRDKLTAWRSGATGFTAEDGTHGVGQTTDDHGFMRDQASRNGALRVRDAALRTLESGKAFGIPEAAWDATLDRWDGVLRGHDDRDRSAEDSSKIARWVRATGDPAYMSAWLKMARDPMSGAHEFDDAERAAWRFARSEERAMSLTDSAGGYLVPFQLDPAVILTSAGSASSIREISRTVVATGDVWNGVSSAGVTAGWLAEAAEASDNAPTMAQPSIQIHKLAAFVPISVEAMMDEQNIAAEVARLLADGALQAENEAFITGSGSGQPVGIVTALTGTASEVNQTGTTLDTADFYAVQEALSPRWQANASWIMHLVSLNRARSIIAGTGLTTPLLAEGNPATLLGRPAYEASFMDSSVTGSASDYLTVYGDFSNYVIADRIGTTIELIPHLFGANRRPTGQRGWWMYKRVGADSVNDAAFRMLDKSA